jgi:hypothetical protein
MWQARERTETVQGLMGKPEGKRQLERPRRRWGMESECVLGRSAGGVEWIQLAQDRDRWRALVSTVLNIRLMAERS